MQFLIVPTFFCFFKCKLSTTVLIVLSVGFHSVPTLILNKSGFTKSKATLWHSESSCQHPAVAEVSPNLVRAGSATKRAHFTSIWMTGRTITKHNCHLYKLSCILCPWCRDNAHWKGVMSSPAPLRSSCVNTVKGCIISYKQKKPMGLFKKKKNMKTLYCLSFFLHLHNSPKSTGIFKDVTVYLFCSTATLLPNSAASNPHQPSAPSTSPCRFFFFFFRVSPWQSPREPHLPWHMANKAGTASEWPCLELWLSVVPQCLWQHRDRGMKGMEEEGERRCRDRRRVGVGGEVGCGEVG